MLTLARQQNLTITEDVSLNLHRLFYQKVDADQAGSYRTIQVYISGTEYIAPDPDDVPRLMKHLADQIHFSQSTLHPNVSLKPSAITAGCLNYSQNEYEMAVTSCSPRLDIVTIDNVLQIIYNDLGIMLSNNRLLLLLEAQRLP